MFYLPLSTPWLTYSMTTSPASVSAVTHEPICSSCWRTAYPKAWPPPWKLTDITEKCAVCGCDTESGISRTRRTHAE